MNDNEAVTKKTKRYGFVFRAATRQFLAMYIGKIIKIRKKLVPLIYHLFSHF